MRRINNDITLNFIFIFHLKGTIYENVPALKGLTKSPDSRDLTESISGPFSWSALSVVKTGLIKGGS